MMKKLLIFLLIFALDFHYGQTASMMGFDAIGGTIGETLKDTIGDTFGDESEEIAQPYLWPDFPFIPGLNFPPSTPSWMSSRRPGVEQFIPEMPDNIRLPPIQLPWPHDDDDDDDEDDDDEYDDEDDVEECPDEGVKLISHPENCEKYILCMEGNEITEIECENGKHFSRDYRTCMDPDDAGCE